MDGEEEEPYIDLESGSEESTVSTISKRPRRGPTPTHPIWNYFDQDRDSGSSICKCIFRGSPCGKKLAGLKAGNCEYHLKSSHSDVFKEYSVQKQEFQSHKPTAKKLAAETQRKMSEYFTTSQVSKYSSTGLRATEITNALAFFIGTTGVAKRVVEVDAFKEFVAKLDPKYDVPSRFTITRRVKSISTTIQENVATALSNSKFVSLCADIWSRPGLSEAFLGVSAHFFNCATNSRQRALLALFKFPSPHTGDRIKEAVGTILQKSQIPEGNVMYYVTDNASNMIKAFRSVNTAVLSAYEESLDDEDEEGEETFASVVADPNLESEDDEGAWNKEVDDFEAAEVKLDTLFTKEKHLRCFAHTLMLVLGAAVGNDNMFKQLRQSVLIVVRHIIRSVRLNERIKKASGLKVLLPASTRWNSIYYVFERLLRVRDAVDDTCKEEAWDLINWQKLESVKGLLQPFATYTDVIQGERYPTLSNVVPVLLELQAHLDKVSNLEPHCIMET